MPFLKFTVGRRQEVCMKKMIAGGVPYIVLMCSWQKQNHIVKLQAEKPIQHTQ